MFEVKMTQGVRDDNEKSFKYFRSPVEAAQSTPASIRDRPIL